MKYVAIFIMAFLFLFGVRPVIAQTNTPLIELAESDFFIVVCAKNLICKADAPPDVIAQRLEMARRIADEADLIHNWFIGFGYPPLRIDRRNGKYLLVVAHDGVCRGSANIACHKDVDIDFGILRTVFLPGNRFISGGITPNTLAHELSHGLEETVPKKESAVFWLGEAMAEAIGNAWPRHSNQIGESRRLAKSLDLPFHLGTDGGYEKFDYLEDVGLDLSSSEMIEYLKDFYPIVESDHRGMSLLYDSVEDETFDRAYPPYVARYNSMDDNLSGASGNYYNAYVTTTIALNYASGAFSTIYDRNVSPFAADPVYFKSITVSHAADDEAKDVLLVADISILSADRMGDTQLVFEHRVADNGRYRYLFTGISPIDGGFARVTNAASDVGNTVAQTYRLEFQALPVEFELPSCMAVNATVEIPLIVGSLAGVGNWELRPSAGSISGQTFTAPSSPGDIEITLLITSHITRAEEGIEPATPEVTEVSLGTIPVRSKLCNIRMKMMSESGTLTATYDTTLDYSEFLAPEGVKMYIAGSRVAIFEPSGRWLPIPAGAQAMVMGQLHGMMALASPPPWAEVQNNFLHRTPLMFSQWYGWVGVTDMAFPGVLKSRIGTPVACPLGGQDCVAISAAGLGLIYNEDRQIEQVTQGQQVGQFAYGSFNIGLPPGW